MEQSQDNTIPPTTGVTFDDIRNKIKSCRMDGLYNTEVPCACLKEDLAPCGMDPEDVEGDCIVGKYIEVDADETCGCDGEGESHWHIADPKWAAERVMKAKSRCIANLNETVLVKITGSGLEILERNHDSLKARFPSIGKFKPPKVDEHGYSECQLRTLFQDFGPHIRAGFHEQPFAAEIIFKKESS